MLPEDIDLLLDIINSSLSLGYVLKTFKLAVVKPLNKKTQLDPKYIVNLQTDLESPFSDKDTRKCNNPHNYIPSWRKKIYMRISSQDLDNLIVLRLLSLE